MSTIPDAELDSFGSNAPVHRIDGSSTFVPVAELGASSYRQSFPNGAQLDALLVNKGSDILVVGLHGATNRETTTLPRYERLRSINAHNVSAMYFADPSLWLDPRLQLAWYTGWDELDISRLVADWIEVTARTIGAERVVVTGASGGGFAALQIAAHLPDSLALAFNPQTDIAAYRINGVSFGAQLEYVRVLWPKVHRSFAHWKDIRNPEWAAVAPLRLSAVRNYELPTKNYVHIVQNVNEFHMEDHFVPFVASMARAGIGYRLNTTLYEGGNVHNPPPNEVYERELANAVLDARALPRIT